MASPRRHSPAAASRPPSAHSSAAAPAGEFVLVGRITAPVGLDGSVRVESHSDVPHRFAAGAVLWLDGVPQTIERSRPGRLPVIKLLGVNTREAAEKLRGKELVVPEAAVPQPAADSYYHYQLMDMQVVDPNGKLLGVITDILDYPANDVYVVTLEGRELLVPAVGDVVKVVDVAAKRMVVDLPEAV